MVIKTDDWTKQTILKIFEVRFKLSNEFLLIRLTGFTQDLVFNFVSIKDTLYETNRFNIFEE